MFIPVISHTSRIASAPPPTKNCGCQINNLFRSCSDHVRADQEHRLDGVLLEPGPQVLLEQPYCGEETLDADLRHRERSERLVTAPHRSWVGWDDVPRIPLCKNFDGKWEGHQWLIQRQGFGSG